LLASALFGRVYSTPKIPKLECCLIPSGDGAEGKGSGAEDNAAAEADDRDRHDPFAEELDEQVCHSVAHPCSLPLTSH